MYATLFSNYYVIAFLVKLIMRAHSYLVKIGTVSSEVV